jgi:hypothetical protein
MQKKRKERSEREKHVIYISFPRTSQPGQIKRMDKDEINKSLQGKKG